MNTPGIGNNSDYTEDPYQTREYQLFVESMVKYCHCKPSNRPCDGVLAGGPCDDVQEQTEEHDESDD